MKLLNVCETEYQKDVLSSSFLFYESKQTLELQQAFNYRDHQTIRSLLITDFTTVSTNLNIEVLINICGSVLFLGDVGVN